MRNTFSSEPHDSNSNKTHLDGDIAPNLRYGKPLDSNRLKRGLDKVESLKKAAAFSRAIVPGQTVICCPLCGEKNRAHLCHVYGFAYVECSQCGSAYVENPPSESDISAAYRSDYYTAANKVLLANRNVIDYRLQEVARPKVAFALEYAKRGARRWLDIGCGVGEILAAVREHGLETLGIETNRMEADFARDHFKLDVVEKYIDASNLSEFQGYDVISLFSVIEHVPDPNALLETVAKLQRAGETLVIETPHFPSVSAFSQIAFPDLVNRMMHPPLHLFLFSLTAIDLLLTRHGYKIKAAWMFGQDFYEFLSTIAIMAPISGTRLQSAFAELTNKFQLSIDSAGLSDEMLLVAERLPDHSL
jgi:2-polyprenyl-3-methyl-5-hydroxy-6-metoxy-1,4-benzoquinol methylase